MITNPTPPNIAPTRRRWTRFATFIATGAAAFALVSAAPASADAGVPFPVDTPPGTCVAPSGSGAPGTDGASFVAPIGQLRAVFPTQVVTPRFGCSGITPTSIWGCLPRSSCGAS